MFDLQQKPVRNQHFSFNPVYKSNSSYLSKRTTDFDFRNSPRTENSESSGGSSDGSGGNEIEFQTQTQIADDYIVYSPPFWTRKSSRNIGYEVASPLLPYKQTYSYPSPTSRLQAIEDGQRELMEMVENIPESGHHYSYPSPTSRLQAIVDGKRELLEMIENIPEFSYELSLKDIVDEQQNMQGGQQGLVIEERSLKLKTELRIKQKKTKTSKRRQISRSESMGSGVFLLKMFLPIPLYSKKKSTTGKCSKVSPRPTLGGSEKPVDTEWWKKRFLVTGPKENTSSISRNPSSINSSEHRYGEISLPLGCWSFRGKNCKSRRHKGWCF
ncbi:unnamed protein product [Ilex paraguariensis]|uniref:Uncharacterized protein n=1 Tax=Ilex paraguariensis TaxID=185542 RepID=A0ABC8TRE8_9AQUA